uniref:Laminin, gamma 2 n=1 Tax=Hippocampus comes TaxID=109280 RepID=A0A3Q3DYJ8_HIPCM
MPAHAYVYVCVSVCLCVCVSVWLASLRCECNGRSSVCVRDARGLRCVDCSGNSQGRQCERCKDGFYQQGATLSCTPCGCHPAGSVSSRCDSRGRCACREGVTGTKCDLCPNGPIGPQGCSPSAFCFCYGHSSQCSPQSTYSVHNISSTFEHGPDGWKAATSHGLTPADVHSRWSPNYKDMEVISRNSLPVYLYAPASYLGNKLLSYGHNLSFSLRLDRGIRHPSINDVILEGSGHRVSASLGDLRSIVPCGQKINYTFRLDEQPGSRWRPQLTPFQFQTLLQNLSTIKIRATFGDRGRGYLDNVNLISARRGEGSPAHWVRTCVCPSGYEGDFCQQCSAGFKRRRSTEGAFSPCEPCSCMGGDCDPQTGDCYPADETQTCSNGWQLCRPCQCNGNIDVSVAGSCDRTSGECLKCVNNTMGRFCEICLPNFYRRNLNDACRPCDCDLRGSDSAQCDDNGQCRCRPGFEGPTCQTSRECPACFNGAKAKVRDHLGSFTPHKPLRAVSAILFLHVRFPDGGISFQTSAVANTELSDWWRAQYRQQRQRGESHTNTENPPMSCPSSWLTASCPSSGFDQQIANGQAQADAAIKRLPAINATIQRAAKNNVETRGLLDAVSADSDGAMASINRLESLIPNQPGTFDPSRLQELEKSLAATRQNVETNLEPQLRDAIAREAAQRRRLALLNRDIDTILWDIANLEDILATVPEGCFNSPPIEKP